MRLSRTTYRRFARSLLMVSLGIGAIVAAILAIDVPLTVWGQAGGLPLSPNPAVPDSRFEVSTTEAEKAAAFEHMMTMMESTLGPMMGMKDPRNEMSHRKMYLDNVGFWHFKLDQVFQGIPVKDGGMAITMRTDAAPGQPIALDDAVKAGELGADLSGRPVFHENYQRDPEVDTKPVISSQEALAIVRAMVNKEIAGHPRQNAAKGAPQQLRVDTPTTDKASLEVHPGGGPGQRKLTYHTIVSDTSTTNPVQMHAWVGAQADNARQVLESYNNIQTTFGLDGTGRTFYQGTAPYFKIAFWSTFGVYVLNDLSLRIGAFDAYSSCSATYQASSGSSVFGNLALSDRNSTNADTLWATVQTMSYYFYNHGRNYVDNNFGPTVYGAVDGAGALLSARNHVCSGYNNAYWDGQKINLGDGDGVTFRSFATLDIIGHEWTHGVTQYEAGLNYSGESGALNEAFSDIFGAMVERYWYGERFIGCPSGVFTACSLTGQIGEGAFTPGTAGDALRYMYAPTLDGYSRDYYPFRLCTTCSSDNGGVHGNSGIQNNAFWLLAYGGCHRFTGCTSGGIGADAAKQLFYLALRDYLIPTDGFYWARYGTQYEAGVLYGFSSFHYNATKRAWDLVGAPS